MSSSTTHSGEDVIPLEEFLADPRNRPSDLVPAWSSSPTYRHKLAEYTEQGLQDAFSSPEQAVNSLAQIAVIREHDDQAIQVNLPQELIDAEQLTLSCSEADVKPDLDDMVCVVSVGSEESPAEGSVVIRYPLEMLQDIFVDVPYVPDEDQEE